MRFAGLSFWCVLWLGLAGCGARVLSIVRKSAPDGKTHLQATVTASSPKVNSVLLCIEEGPFHHCPITLHGKETGGVWLGVSRSGKEFAALVCEFGGRNRLERFTSISAADQVPRLVRAGEDEAEEELFRSLQQVFPGKVRGVGQRSEMIGWFCEVGQGHAAELARRLPRGQPLLIPYAEEKQ